MRRVLAPALVALVACESFVVGEAPSGGAGGSAVSTQSSVSVASTQQGAGVSGTNVSSNGAASTSAGPGPRPDDVIPSFVLDMCPSAMDWSLTCITIAGQMAVGFEPNGEICLLSSTFGNLGAPNGLAVIGETLLTCDETGNVLVRYDGSNKTVSASNVGCVSVADVSDTLYVLQSSGTVIRGASFDALQQMGGVPTMILPSASRLGGYDTTLWAAMSSADALDRWDAQTEMQLPPFGVGGTRSINGMSPMADGRIVLLSQGKLLIFDRTGSEPTTEYALNPMLQDASGLRCYAQ